MKIIAIVMGYLFASLLLAMFVGSLLKRMNYWRRCTRCGMFYSDCGEVTPYRPTEDFIAEDGLCSYCLTIEKHTSCNRQMTH